MWLFIVIGLLVFLFLGFILYFTLNKNDGHYRVFNDDLLDDNHQITFANAYLNNVWHSFWALGWLFRL